MTSVRTVVQPGWLEVTGPGVHALVAAADRHAESLRTAAAGGLLPLLEALTAHGISAAPDFVVVAPGDAGVRVLVRGAGVVVLADGTRVGADGRMPWADVDIDLAVAGDEVVAQAPEPQAPRGWRRPARLGRADAGAPPAVPVAAVLAGSPAGEVQPEAADQAAAEPEPEADASAAPEPDLTRPPPDDGPGLPPVPRVPASPPPRGGLSEAVPWRRGGGATPDPLPPTAAMPVTPPPPPPASGEEHEPQPPPPEHAVPDVTTVVCPAGHPSPPHAGRCRMCDREIPPQQPFQAPRPPLGVLRISTGGVVLLDRGVLLGRAPRVDEELPADQRPHLVRVGGADRDISRNHAEVVLEGWHVLVRDLGSTNGTTVTLPGQEPVRLRPTEDQGIEPGAVITLAGEVSLTYEVEE